MFLGKEKDMQLMFNVVNFCELERECERVDCGVV